LRARGVAGPRTAPATPNQLLASSSGWGARWGLGMTLPRCLRSAAAGVQPGSHRPPLPVPAPARVALPPARPRRSPLATLASPARGSPPVRHRPAPSSRLPETYDDVQHTPSTAFTHCERGSETLDFAPAPLPEPSRSPRTPRPAALDQTSSRRVSSDPIIDPLDPHSTLANFGHPGPSLPYMPIPQPS
jgi:hypothetical protein